MAVHQNVWNYLIQRVITNSFLSVWIFTTNLYIKTVSTSLTESGDEKKNALKKKIYQNILNWFLIQVKKENVNVLMVLQILNVKTHQVFFFQYHHRFFVLLIFFKQINVKVFSVRMVGHVKKEYGNVLMVLQVLNVENHQVFFFWLTRAKFRTFLLFLTLVVNFLHLS